MSLTSETLETSLSRMERNQKYEFAKNDMMVESIRTNYRWMTTYACLSAFVIGALFGFVIGMLC